jgi:hypothetical protein
MRYSVDQGILISATALAKKIPERMEIAKGYWQRALKTDCETQQLVQKLTKGLGRLTALRFEYTGRSFQKERARRPLS